MKLKHLIWILLFAQLSTFSQENNESDIIIEIPDSYHFVKFNDTLKDWRVSLYKKYNIDESIINEEIFLKTDIKILVNGKIIDQQVYKSISDDNRFFIKTSHTLIDFRQKLVGTMGVSGISVFQPKTKPIVIVMAPTKNINLLGITLDFAIKTRTSTPIFNKNTVSFKWMTKN